MLDDDAADGGELSLPPPIVRAIGSAPLTNDDAREASVPRRMIFSVSSRRLLVSMCCARIASMRCEMRDSELI